METIWGLETRRRSHPRVDSTKSQIRAASSQWVNQTLSSRLSSRVINIDDLRRIARRRLPPVVFDYLDGGADGEITLRENCRAFDSVIFRPRQAVSISECDLKTRVLGANLSFPTILAPV